MKLFFEDKKYLTALFILIVAVDQFMKYKIRQEGGFYICNGGISFSISFSNLKFLISLLYFCIFFFFLRQNKENFLHWQQKLAAILFLGGSFSNLLDRFLFGCVIDHIKMFFLFFFNVADIFIFVGSAFLIYSLLKKSPNCD